MSLTCAGEREFNFFFHSWRDIYFFGFLFR
jgi:hypothetical protein